MKKVIRIVLLLAVVGGGYWYWQNRNKQPANRIALSGNLELTQVDLSFKIPGKVVELNVREGDWVKKGQVIAKLDSVQLSEQRSRDRATVIAAQSQKQQLQTSIDYQKATVESEVASRRAEAAQAQARLDELLAGSRPQEIQQAQAAVMDAKAANEFAQRDFERAETLYKNEDISRQQHDQARTKVETTTAALRQAEQSPRFHAIEIRQVGIDYDLLAPN
jgi:HlyD family secretion protein